jgi:hypothetical protein
MSVEKTPAPGTPEWDAEYEKAAAELAATGLEGRGKATEKATPPEPEKKEAEPEKKTEGSTDDKPAPKEEKPEPTELEKLKAELEEKTRLIEGTKNWADKQLSKRDRESAKLKKELDELKKKVPKPEALEALPGLEEAVASVVKDKFKLEEPDPEDETNEEDDEPQFDSESWNQIVMKAIPNLVQMAKADKDLADKLTAKRKAVGEEMWKDPLAAVGHMNQVILTHTQEKLEARLRKEREQDPLRVPGGSGGSPADKKKDDDESYDDVMNLSKEDFDKRVEKIKNKPR